MSVMHVSTITKNLVSVGQIVDQGMQVRFTNLGCFIEEEGKVITQGCREGRMFILETNEVGTAIFAKGAEGQVGYRPMAQAVRPYELPVASGNADEEHRSRITEI